MSPTREVRPVAVEGIPTHGSQPATAAVTRKHDDASALGQKASGEHFPEYVFDGTCSQTLLTRDSAPEQHDEAALSPSKDIIGYV